MKYDNLSFGHNSGGSGEKIGGGGGGEGGFTMIKMIWIIFNEIRYSILYTTKIKQNLATV